MNSNVKNYLHHQVAGYVSKSASIEHECLRFDMGENFMDLPDHILDTVKNFDLGRLKKYPSHHYEKSTAAIAKKFNLAPEYILPTAGADEAIGLVPRSLCEPGDSSVIAVPTFYRIIEANVLNRVKNSFVPLKEGHGFAYNDSFINDFCTTARREQARVAWVCTPNNPTGIVLSLDQLDMILLRLPKDCFLVVDEAYHEFFDPENTQSAIGKVEKHPNLIVIKSLSKGYGLAGIRFGYMVANPDVIRAAMSMRPTFSISAMAEELVAIVIAEQHLASNMTRPVIADTKNLIDSILKLGPYEVGAQTKTNIFILRHKEKDLYEELLRRHIVVADFRHSLGLEGRNFVRVSVREREKNVKLLAVLADL